MLNGQILCNYSSFYFLDLLLWHIDCMVQILSANLGILLLHLFSQLPSSEQALLVPIVEVPSVSSAKLETIAIFAWMSLCYLTSEPVDQAFFTLLVFLSLVYFLSSSYLMQLLYHIIT